MPAAAEPAVTREWGRLCCICRDDALHTCREHLRMGPIGYCERHWLRHLELYPEHKHEESGR